METLVRHSLIYKRLAPRTFNSPKRCTCNIDHICIVQFGKKATMALSEKWPFFLALFKMSWNREEIGPEDPYSTF